MKRMTVMATLLLALGVAAVRAQSEQTKVSAEPVKAHAASLVEATAKVEAIDQATRTVTLKGEKGEVFDVICGDEVKNFDQIKVGDNVHFQYYESLSLSLEQATGAAPAVSEKVSEVRAEKGDLPGAVKTREVTITAKVTAVDPKAWTVTVVGPKGRSVTLDVAPDTLAKVKVGDMVQGVYTEAVAISLSRVEVH